MFKEERSQSRFEWAQLGDIAVGRPNLGPLTSVAVYRLMQYTMRDVMIRRLGVEEANSVLYEAGRVAGQEFCRHLLDTEVGFDAFVSSLAERLIQLNIGILRVEVADLGRMEFTLTVSEDLDCSGLPVTEETVCNYDEGFIAGILHSYTGREFDVREIDCWATGERTCRFRVVPAVAV